MLSFDFTFEFMMTILFKSQLWFDSIRGDWCGFIRFLVDGEPVGLGETRNAPNGRNARTMPYAQRRKQIVCCILEGNRMWHFVVWYTMCECARDRATEPHTQRVRASARKIPTNKPTQQMDCFQSAPRRQNAK